jgi:prostaglandin-endoperoxide synthase 2
MGPVAYNICRSWPWLYRWANRKIINNAIGKVQPPRPYRLSTKAPYTSWETLTDRSYTARELPPAESVLETPTAEQLLTLFTRTDFKESPKSSVLFAYFAQWFTDGILRSDRSVLVEGTNKIKEPRDVSRNESTHEVDLAQVYGLTPEDGEVLRSRTDRALLAYQLIKGEEYPPDLYAHGARVAQFESLRIIGTEKDAVDRGELLAMGSDAGNTQIGYSMFNALFLRAHNKLAREIRADQLERGDPWEDERVFAATRNALIVLTIKLVIEEYINHISPWAFQFKFDPTGFQREKWQRQNWMAVEFNLLYRWHCLLPPELKIGGKPHTLWDTMFKTRTLFAEHGLGALLEDAARQPAGAIELFNTGDPLLLHTAELPTLKAGRAVRLRTYNEYRRHCGFEPAKSFEEFSSDPRVVDGLRRVYGNVDAVEFYPGIFAEDRVTNSVVPPTMGRLIAVHAFSQLLTNRLLAPAVYESVETFSARGRELIDSTAGLKGLVDWVLPPRKGGYNVSLTINRSETKMTSVDVGQAPLLAAFDELASHPAAAELQRGLVMKWVLEQPAELFAELRAHRPIFRTPIAVIFSLYEDVVAIANQDDSFSVALYGDSLRRYTEDGNFLLGMDDSEGFDHDRALLMLAIRRADLGEIRSFASRCAQEKLAESEGRIDLDEYGRSSCAEIMDWYYFGDHGLGPADLMAWCRAMYSDIFVGLGQDVAMRAAGEQAGAQFRAAVETLIAAQSTNGAVPNSVMARLLAHKAVNPSLSDRRIRDNLIGCTVGVIDNVGCAMANAFNVLLDRPDDLHAATEAAKADQDDVVLRYVLEALRFHPAASILVRVAMRDVDVARGTERETRIPRGTLVFAASGSATMDERAVTQPEFFDLNRPQHHYLHYGWGMHRCLGYHFANAQLTQLAKALLRQQNLRRAPDPTGQLTYTGAYPNRFELEFDPA